MGESTSGIVRTRSEQLETVSGVKSLSRTASAEAITIQEINSSSGQSLSGKQGFGKKPTGTSPGRKGANHHTRKSRGSQKLELEEFNSGAALSRASSASLGFSFSFTGFTAPPEDIKDDPGHFSDEEIDLEAGVKQKRMLMEPTLPIYLKFTEVKCKDGKTVITTIHQPSSRLFHKFDKLILLGKGCLLYFGKASEAMLYFRSIGCSPLIEMNPAEFLLDLANGNINDVSVPSELDDKVQTENLGSGTRNDKPTPKDVHEYLVEAYETRVASKEKNKLLMPIPISDDLKAKIMSPNREWGASWRQQYSILFRRGLKERRYDYLSWMRITQVIATAIVLGLLWWQSDTKSVKGLQDQAGLLFFIAVFWGFFPVFTAIFTFPQERAMLNKERAVDMYRLSAYFMARTTSDIPLDLFLPVIFMLIVYFMAGLRQSPESFFLSMLTVFLSIVASQGLGLAIGATLMDIKKATTLASVTVMTFMLAGGFFVKRVPVFISWIRYLSFNYHTYRLLLKVQYDYVPSYLNINHIDNGVKEVCVMIAMIFGYRLLAYLSLRRINITKGA